MSDTSPEIEAKYREMLLQRPAAERLKMGCSMFATARALAMAAVREREPSASPGSLRRALFLSFYGSDFEAEERERIAAWLERQEPEPAPSTTLRHVAVDWADLETALTTSREEWTHYLDVRSGRIEMVPTYRFDDDGEWPSEEAIDAGVAAGHLIAVEPLGSSVAYGWMMAFASSLTNTRLRDRLEVALDGRGAFRRFDSVLLHHPAERERWFAFRDERLWTVAREWLAEHDLEPTTDPKDPGP